MSNRPEFELLSEIAKLLKKYGPETFESLSENLSSPEFSECLVSVLTTAAKVGRTTRAKEVKTTEQRRSPRDFRSSLVAIGKTEPEKSALLVKFYDGLTAKTFLPTLRDVQAFVSDTGLPPVKAKARHKAIVPLVKALLPLSLEDIKAKLSVIKRVPVQDDRSLEGWSNLILDKERRAKQQE